MMMNWREPTIERSKDEPTIAFVTNLGVSILANYSPPIGKRELTVEFCPFGDVRISPNSARDTCVGMDLSTGEAVNLYKALGLALSHIVGEETWNEEKGLDG
jgi:hypothetical protein